MTQKKRICTAVLSALFAITSVCAAEPVSGTDPVVKTQKARKAPRQLKSISQKGLERRKDFLRPDSSDVEEKSDTPASNYIPQVPSNYLRGEDQTKEATEALKSSIVKAPAEAPKPAAKKSSTVQLNTDDRISMKPGGNVYIPISREHPNRLIVPFSNPQVISTSLRGGTKKGECGEVCVRNGIIYITTDSQQAVTAFITQKGNEEVAFSVTMLPRAMPPREVHFSLPQAIVDKVNTKKGSRISGTAEGWEQGQPYVEALRGALRQVAMQEIPPGYTLRAINRNDPLPSCRHPGLKIDFTRGQILEGFNLDIYVGTARNISKTPVEFREQTCGGWRIAAVTSWPLKVMRPGQETEVYIITKKSEEVQEETVRKSLVKREYN